MANLSKTTKNREEIQRWAEERGGKPAHVKSTESSNDIGILRIEFPGFGEEESSLEPITWDQFFDKFEDRDLILIYQEETAGGEKSNFNKLVSAETAAESETGSKSSSKRSAGARKATKSSGQSSSAKKAPAKKASAKKAPAKKSPAKKTSPAKTAGKKTAVKKAPAKKTAAKKTAAKKTLAKKAAAKKAPAKKTPLKKTAAKRRR